jgi:hypothetical protein
MKPAQRLDLIDEIGRELQRRYTFNDIDSYLAAYGVEPPTQGDRSSKWVYTKQALRPVASDGVVLQMAVDLGLRETSIEPDTLALPRSWQGVTDKKVFLSHLSKSKDKAHRLKECLKPWGVSLFVAHDDIHPTAQWQREILRALRNMDAFISLHTPGFSGSIWCQQEVGFAAARDVPIIAIRMGEDPVGFQSSAQALSRGQKTAETISEEIATIWNLKWVPF